jgi:hypothetical protein
MEKHRCQSGELGRAIDGDVDLFICSASFESRCLVVADHINREQVKRALIFENQRHQVLHCDHAIRLLKQFEGRAELVMIDAADPLVTADAMIHSLTKPSNFTTGRILCDVTTFTHESLLILYKVLQMCFARADLWYAYALAGEYSLGDPPPQKWLSKGVDDVRSVLGYSGEMEPSRRMHLIILAGFEHERVAELIRRFEPSLISLGCTDEAEPDASNHMPAHRYGRETLRAIFGPMHDFTFPAYDAEGTKRAILAQRSKFEGFNVVVAPMNTKISAIGAAKAAIEDLSIQLCYAQPVIYNYSAYSKPGDYCYLLREDGSGT